MTSQAAVILLNSVHQPLYVSTEAARILLPSGQAPHKPESVKSISKVVSRLIEAGSWNSEGRRSGFLEVSGNPYLWNISRCDEWTANDTPWNYVLIIRRAEVPEKKIQTVVREFGLSPRQEQTLAYLFRGLTSKEIANFLELSPHTVKIHIRALMTKLQVTTRTGLVGRVLASAEDAEPAETAAL